VPTEDDVFVILSRFEAVDHPSFYTLYQQDKMVCDLLGVEMPEVYGYKTLVKKPVTEMDCEGQSYRVWRKGFFDGKCTPKIRALITAYYWCNAVDDGWSYKYSGPNIKTADALHQHFVDLLGIQHPITVLVRKYVRAYKKVRGLDNRTQNGLSMLADRFGAGRAEDDARKARQSAVSAYPLMVATSHGVSALWGAQDNDWAEYIKLIDAQPSKAAPPKGKKKDSKSKGA